jgi:hypothetical protein
MQFSECGSRMRQVAQSMDGHFRRIDCENAPGREAIEK